MTASLLIFTPIDFKILCNFDNSLTSSYFSGITGEITSYEISKIKNNESFYTKVTTLQESELKTDPDDEDYYYIKTKEKDIKNSIQITIEFSKPVNVSLIKINTMSIQNMIGTVTI